MYSSLPQITEIHELVVRKHPPAGDRLYCPGRALALLSLPKEVEGAVAQRRRKLCRGSGK